MRYKISCWKPENNRQLLSALRLQSSSALGSWWEPTSRGKALRPYPGAGEAGKETGVKANITCQLFSCCIQQVTLPPGKAIGHISQQRLPRAGADCQGSVARQFSCWDQRGGGVWGCGRRLDCPFTHWLLASWRLLHSGFTHWGGILRDYNHDAM